MGGGFSPLYSAGVPPSKTHSQLVFDPNDWSVNMTVLPVHTSWSLAVKRAYTPSGIKSRLLVSGKQL